MTPLNKVQKDWIDQEIRIALKPILLRIAAAFAILLTATVIGSMAAVWEIRENTHRDLERSVQTTMALCTLRDDLQRRVDQSTAFLKEHPNGIPGIPRETFLQGVKNQRSTIDALNALDCKA